MQRLGTGRAVCTQRMGRMLKQGYKVFILLPSRLLRWEGIIHSPKGSIKISENLFKKKEISNKIQKKTNVYEDA